jgi:hypothetical protein
MVIGDKIDCLALALQVDRRLHGAEIIAQVQGPGRLNARKEDLHAERSKLPKPRAKGSARMRE